MICRKNKSLEEAAGRCHLIVLLADVLHELIHLDKGVEADVFLEVDAQGLDTGGKGGPGVDPKVDFFPIEHEPAMEKFIPMRQRAEAIESGGQE